MENETDDKMRAAMRLIASYLRIPEPTIEEESRARRIQPKLSDALQNTNNRALYYRAILDDVVKMVREKSALKLTHEQNVMAKRAIVKLTPLQYISTVEDWYKTNGLEHKLKEIETELGQLDTLQDVTPEFTYRTCINCGREEWTSEACVECKYCRREYNIEEKPKQQCRPDDSDYTNSDERSYRKYGGYNGHDDNTIDSAFEGDPDLTWNID